MDEMTTGLASEPKPLQHLPSFPLTRWRIVIRIAAPDEFIADNGRVIVIGRYHGRHRKSGATLNCQAVHSGWVDGGKIVSFQQYANTAQLARLACVRRSIASESPRVVVHWSQYYDLAAPG